MKITVLPAQNYFLAEELFSKTFASIDSARLNKAKLFTAFVADKFAGAAALEQKSDKESYVWLLAVDEAYRRKGIAKKLLKAIENHARTKSHALLRIKTYQNWHAMKSLLKNQGWAFDGAEKGKHCDGVAEHWILPLVEKPLKIAVIGGGKRGSEWIKAICLCRWFHLKAIVDPDPKIQEKFKTQNLNIYSNIEQLIENEKIDSVVISVPPGVLSEIQTYCIKAKIAILNEKPIAPTLTDLQNLQKELNQNPVPFVLGLQRRKHPSYVYLKNILDDKGIDSLRAIHLKITLGKPDTDLPDGFRREIKLARGGALLDLGIHALDLIQWLLNSTIELVSCSMFKRNDLVPFNQFESEAHILGKCGNVWIRIVLNRNGEVKDEEIKCIFNDDKTITARRDMVFSNLSEPEFTCTASWEDAEKGALANLAVACITKQTKSDLWEQLCSMEIIEKAYSMANIIGLGENWNA